MQLQAGVGFFRPKTTHPLACNCKMGWVSSSFSLRQRTTTSHVGSSSSSASVCTHHDNDNNPPPRLQLRDGCVTTSDIFDDRGLHSRSVLSFHYLISTVVTWFCRL